MKFDELPLYCAIAKVRKHITESGERGAGDSYWEHGKGAIELTRMIVGAMTTTADESLVRAYVKYRKSCGVGDDSGTKKLDIIAELYPHSHVCFYANRGLGECSEDVDLDRILPGAHGGEYSVANCVISCARHNRQRGDMPLAEFLNQVCVEAIQ